MKAALVRSAMALACMNSLAHAACSTADTLAGEWIIVIERDVVSCEVRIDKSGKAKSTRCDKYNNEPHVGPDLLKVSFAGDFAVNARCRINGSVEIHRSGKNVDQRIRFDIQSGWFVQGFGEWRAISSVNKYDLQTSLTGYRLDYPK